MSPQQSIAHYRIVSKAGEGGMGEVWRATDTKLGRDVAVKVIPEAFAQDPDRMARFTREAQVLASLNHPNIAAIYGVEERALVMELVEGPTLAERIAQGAIPLEEALAIARQIAEALEYAHEKAIVHRDLKPANIKITPEGRVKLLDFGLAKAMSSVAAAADPVMSPTLSMGSTRLGVILGTAAYMAPEQARGAGADRRADIWAFGVVLFEMLTGRRLFESQTVSDTLAAVLTREPDLGDAPHEVRRLLRSCLEKDPKRRLRDIGDWWRQLEEAEPAATPSQSGRGWPWLWPAVAMVLAILLMGAGVLLWRSTKATSNPFMQFSVDLGQDLVLGDYRPQLSISPDGTRVVYVSRGADGTQQLSTRLLAEPKPTILAGTQGATLPFFSPDSRNIGFFADQKLKRISVQGGAAVTLCDAVGPRGGAWGENGEIIAALQNSDVLSRIPETGGAPQPLTKLGGETSHRWPQILPGGRSVLFSASESGDSSEAAIEVQRLQGGERKTLLRGGFYPRYLPSGHLVYMHGDTLFAAPMDLERLELTGPAVPVLQEVANSQGLGSAAFDFSQTGTFAYIPGKGIPPGWSIVWLDGSGKATPLRAIKGRYTTPSLSPDGKRLALSLLTNGGDADISVYDWQRDIITKVSTTPGLNDWPVWTPDGKGIVYHSRAKGTNSFFWVRADGASAAVRLTESSRGQAARSFSPDGKRLAYSENGGETRGDLWTLPIDWSDPEHPRADTPELFLRTPGSEIDPAFSPDGRWMAYSSDEESDHEIYVRPFPPNPGGGKWKISNGGGRVAIWSRAAHELFYETLDNRVMVADYTVKGDDFIPDKPRPWTAYRPFHPFAGQQNYDLAPDGRRFAIFEPPLAANESWKPVNILLNFFDELKRKVPVK